MISICFLKKKKHADCHQKADISKNKTLCKQLRDLLSIDKKVLVLPEILKKRRSAETAI